MLTSVTRLTVTCPDCGSWVEWDMTTNSPIGSCRCDEVSA